ncbi:MAG: UDP-2,3-diacylglucosamine diphosphatase [Ekhidna sp.]|uniref:UDP-2,3-diacylglucosamine diphosphatase n=1 Tax=Ekhidna sp. TaxID=2608089 RepID=UPI0032EB0D4E
MKVNPELVSSLKELPSNKKVYFASDFHLGIPNETESLEREQKIVRWLEHVSKDASVIFLLGDLFDFWFEYKTTIPKGFIRFQGKLAELRDRGIPIVIFTGNHDLWMFDYFPKQFGIPIYRKPIELEIRGKKFLIGHGDGLGPGDTRYKITKSIFTNKLCQWLFRWIHPDVGISIAKSWSRNSRIANDQFDEVFKGEKEGLWQYCKSVNEKNPHDFYVFGHRHLSLALPVSDTSTYYNLGEWVNECPYLEFDGSEAVLKTFEG